MVAGVRLFLDQCGYRSSVSHSRLACIAGLFARVKGVAPQNRTRVWTKGSVSVLVPQKKVVRRPVHYLLTLFFIEPGQFDF